LNTNPKRQRGTNLSVTRKRPRWRFGLVLQIRKGVWNQ
jgi:hypothetical protein